MPLRPWRFSRGDDLFRLPLAEIQTVFDEMLVDKVLEAAGDNRTIVETGCGYGYYLWLLARAARDRTYIGGDIADAAVGLADHLFKKEGTPRVGLFNYYAARYDMLERAEGPVLVFTCHSIEQLPTAAPFLDRLSDYADKISGVVHLEPIYEMHSNGHLIGHLRRAYADALDYNRDLLPLLRARSDIVIHNIEPNVLGLNPLNPTSVIHWAFR